jgi:hypothetical protein
MAKKTYQVWHDIGWPQSRLNQVLGGWPPSRFPGDYVQVANVRANGLREAVELTTGRGSLLSYLAHEGQYQPWERNAGVESVPNILTHRDTDRGDVIVDPQGKAYRVERIGFVEVAASRDQNTAYSALFKELRADEAAAKREEAHWYGRTTPQELPAAQSERRPDPEAERDYRQLLEEAAGRSPTNDHDKGVDR